MNKLKRIQTLIYFLISFSLFAQKKVTSVEVNDSIIKNLSWDYFEKRKKSSSPYSAVTSYEYKFNSIPSDGYIIVSVQLYMDLKKSWVRKDIIENSEQIDLLKHEKGHLLIAEYYRRRFISQMEKYTLKDYNKDFIFKKINHETRKCLKKMDKEQKKYDKKTNHSRNTTEQLKWDKKNTDRLVILFSKKEEIKIKVR